MIFSKACEYGLRSVLYLVRHESDDYVPIRTIGEDLGISHHFLTKVLQDLTRVGLLRSSRGPKGGVALRGSPGSYSLYDVIVAIEGADHFESCVLGLPDCNDDHPCPLHQYWGETRKNIKEKFQNVRLDDLLQRMEEEGLRLSHVPLSVHVH